MARYYTLTYNEEVIRLVKIEGKAIESVASSKIPAGVIHDGKIERTKLFAELIIDLKKSAKPHRIIVNEVIAAIPEEKVFLKIIELPKIPLAKIDSAILWQIESIIPYDKKEIYFNWKIIGSSTDKLKILVAVCEKKVVDGLLESLIIAKQKTLVITFPSAGLANLLAQDNKITVIVDLSQKNNILVIAAKNKSIYFSTSRHIDDDFRGLESIIHDAVEYYHQKYSSEEISNILIFGPPNISKVEEAIHKTISERVKFARAEDIKIISNIKEEYVSYIDNLGLDISLEKLNLLPPEIRENTKNENINLRLGSILNYFLLAIIFIGIIFIFAWGKIYLDTLKINSEYSNLTKNQTSGAQKNLESEINTFNNKISIVKAIPFNNALKPGLIEKIVSFVDLNINLKEIKIEQNKNIKIKGIAKNRNDLVIYKDKLNSSGLTGSINLPITALEKKENVEFELNSSIK